MDNDQRDAFKILKEEKRYLTEGRAEVAGDILLKIINSATIHEVSQ